MQTPWSVGMDNVDTWPLGKDMNASFCESFEDLGKYVNKLTNMGSWEPMVEERTLGVGVKEDKSWIMEYCEGTDVPCVLRRWPRMKTWLS